MRTHEFYDLLHERMAEKGYGGKEITCNGGFQIILDVYFCKECDQFHIESEPTESAKELMTAVPNKSNKEILNETPRCI